MLRAHLQAGLELLLQRGHHFCRLVAEQVAAEATEQVDVFVAVEVPEPRSVRSIDHDRVHEILPQRMESGDHSGIGHEAAMLLAERLGLAGARVVAADEIREPALLVRRDIPYRRERESRRRPEGRFDEGSGEFRV
jgi:hypothetical protein